MGDFDRLYNKTLRFLSFRPRSEKEVRDYLKRHSGEDSERKRRGRLQNLLATERNGRDSALGQNDEKKSIIEKIVAKLREQKFINDEEFARWWIESRLRFRPRAISLIRRELREKGVDREVIDTQISNLIHSTGSGQISNELENAQKLIKNKIKRYKDLSRQVIYQKLGSYLASKGFDWETIEQAIDEVVTRGYN